MIRKLIFLSILLTLNFTSTYSQTGVQVQSQKMLLNTAIREIKRLSVAVRKDSIGFEQPNSKNIILGDLQRAKDQIKQIKKAGHKRPISELQLRFLNGVIDKIVSLKVKDILSIGETRDLKTTLILKCLTEDGDYPIRFVTKEGKKVVPKKYIIVSRNIFESDPRVVNGGATTPFETEIPTGKHWFWAQHHLIGSQKSKKRIIDISCSTPKTQHFYMPIPEEAKKINES